ncbi:hypothetical protein [Morganella sp. GD04133]|jgi:hypothetical protein|uniref:hypothetical protein n=1 Tax=Morganella sp. GD04133 TaxID=2975435 RepID=UPI00244C0A3D|nr:hypothetical protein [Morganella sp. GD04133]MDH0355726.1 hypothetical protein [Morganella sp. GD04133]
MVGGIIKDILKAVTNALLDRKKESDVGYQKDDAYPEHDKLVLELNEEIRLHKMLGVRNPDFQQSILWAVNNGKQRIRKDKIKYFDRHIKHNNGILSVDEKEIKAQGRVALFMVFWAAILLPIANYNWKNGDTILTSAILVGSFLLMIMAMFVGLTPTKNEISDMKKQLHEYNNRDSSADNNE